MTYAKLKLIKSESGKVIYSEEFYKGFNYYAGRDFTLVLNGENAFIEFSNKEVLEDFIFRKMPD